MSRASSASQLSPSLWSPAPSSLVVTVSSSFISDRLLDGFAVELSEARGAHGLAEHLVVRHAGKQVVALGRDVVVGRPLLALQLHVGALPLGRDSLEQLRKRESHRVLRGESDEEELVPKCPELREGDRIGVVKP